MCDSSHLHFCKRLLHHKCSYMIIWVSSFSNKRPDRHTCSHTPSSFNPHSMLMAWERERCWSLMAESSRKRLLKYWHRKSANAPRCIDLSFRAHYCQSARCWSAEPGLFRLNGHESSQRALWAASRLSLWATEQWEQQGNRLTQLPSVISTSLLILRSVFRSLLLLFSKDTSSNIPIRIKYILRHKGYWSMSVSKRHDVYEKSYSIVNFSPDLVHAKIRFSHKLTVTL